MSENKKKEEDYSKYFYDPKKPRDLTIESFKEEDPSKWFITPKHRLNAKCIDSPAYVRGIPKKLPPYDPFLAYLEFKMSIPWYRRLFMP